MPIDPVLNFSRGGGGNSQLGINNNSTPYFYQEKHMKIFINTFRLQWHLQVIDNTLVQCVVYLAQRRTKRASRKLVVLKSYCNCQHMTSADGSWERGMGVGVRIDIVHGRMAFKTRRK